MYFLTDLIDKDFDEKKVKMGKALFDINSKKKVNILAMGDVGSTIMMGLKLLGGDQIESIGIFDFNEKVLKRYEMELNQINYPWDYDSMPEVRILDEKDLFDCDIFVFCASKAVPAITEANIDVRMVQYEANKLIISKYAKTARDIGFKGLFAVVSDPVDPLCNAAFDASNRNEDFELDFRGLKAEQIQGYGLGVMNSRAAYYAKKNHKYARFLEEGRAFGPHGKDLVIADSIKDYNDEVSKELTELAVLANLKTRELGFKPYIAPALSSGAISLLLTMRGHWHYSSVNIGGYYFGCKNRFTEEGVFVENLELPEKLFKRIKWAYDELKNIADY